MAWLWPCAQGQTPLLQLAAIGLCLPPPSPANVENSTSKLASRDEDMEQNLRISRPRLAPEAQWAVCNIYRE